MQLWDGDLLNFHFGDTNHSLSNWGVSIGHSASVSPGLHGATPDLFSSEGLNGHWPLDNIMPLLSAESLIDVAHDGVSSSSSLTGSVETAPAVRHQESSALILPTVLKVEEPFAMPLPVDTIANLGADTFIDLVQDGLMPDMMVAKPAWTIPMRLAMLH